MVFLSGSSGRHPLTTVLKCKTDPRWWRGPVFHEEGRGTPRTVRSV